MRTLTQITEILNTDLRDLFKHGQLVDETFLGKLESMLVRIDLPMKYVRRIVENVERSYSRRVVQLDEIVAVVQTELTSNSR